MVTPEGRHVLSPTVMFLTSIFYMTALALRHE